jgi:arylformamidase
LSIVYRDMDQRALDFQYNNRAHVADPQRHVDWYTTASEVARARVIHVPGIVYGPLPDERLDVFTPAGLRKGETRPVVIFVHGGAWQHLGLACSSFPAETVTNRGAIYVALGFRRLPAAGSLDEMVAQVRTALAWLWLNIEQYGGDCDRLHLVGHSSGAHLSAMAICTDWPRLHGAPAKLLRSAVVISGIYDLEPVRLSFRNEILKLDRAGEIRNSPCHNLPADGVPLLVGYGELETDEFKRQAKDFAAIWECRYGNSRLLELQGLNHYETIETITEAESTLSREVFAWFAI